MDFDFMNLPFETEKTMSVHAVSNEYLEFFDEPKLKLYRYGEKTDHIYIIGLLWAAIVEYSKLDHLRTYFYECDSPEKSFKTESLREIQNEFNLNVYAFMDALGDHTAPRSSGFQSAIPDRFGHDDRWQWPEDVRYGIDILNKSAEAVFTSHQLLVESARKILPV